MLCVVCCVLCCVLWPCARLIVRCAAIAGQTARFLAFLAATPKLADVVARFVSYVVGLRRVCLPW